MEFQATRRFSLVRTNCHFSAEETETSEADSTVRATEFGSVRARFEPRGRPICLLSLDPRHWPPCGALPATHGSPTQGGFLERRVGEASESVINAEKQLSPTMQRVSEKDAYDKNQRVVQY